MDDDFGFTGGGSGGDFGGEQPQQQPIPEPWTTADAQRLDRLNAGLAGLQNQRDDGTLTDQEFQPLYDRVNGLRQPLLGKQQSANQAAVQQQQVGMMHERAQAAAANQEDAKFNAAGFGDRMYRHVDERTGQETTFYQQRPGHWAPIENTAEEGEAGVADYVSALAGSPAEEQGGGEGGKPDYMPIGLTESIGAAPGDANKDQAPPGGFFSLQTIGNGSNTQKIIRDAQGNIINKTGSDGSEPKKGQDALFGLDQKTMGQIEAIAQAQTMHMRNGVHRDVAMSRIRGQLIAGVIGEKARQERAATAADLLDKKNQAITDRMGATAKAAHNAGFTQHDVYDMTKKEEDDLAKSDEPIDKFKVDGVEYGGPAKGLPRKVRQAIADQRVRERLERIAGGSSGSSAGGQEQQPAAPPISDKDRAAINDRVKGLNPVGTYNNVAGRKAPASPALPGQADRDKERSMGFNPRSIY